MSKKRNFDVEALWQVERLGAPSMSPDGTQAVVSVTRYDMDSNKGASALHLLSTLGGDARRLTHAGDKDGAPQWSPTGELIAFVAKREQEGTKDEEPQLYVMPPDGGEARRVGLTGGIATGVAAFKWFPDGRRIAFVSWVWPALKGAAAQAKAHKEFKARKATGYVTNEAAYRYWDHHIPMGRVAHLHVLDIETGKSRDLFEGTDFELARSEPDATTFDISPDGRRIVFSFNPARDKLLSDCFALAEVSIKSGDIRTLLQIADWHLHAPRYSHSGGHLAFLASNYGVAHWMPPVLGVLDTHGQWAVVSGEWDRTPNAPLVWADDDLAILFAAEDRGRRHLWRFDLNSRSAEIVFEGGQVNSFSTSEAGVIVVNHDSLSHPPRLTQLGAPARARIDSFNDEVLSKHRLSAHEAVTLKGAQGDDVQMWLIYPPGFDPKKKYPVMQLIHGGPHSFFGDSWHYRWNHQVFAAEGYVVACVNFHGSSGFGQAFLNSITHRWGELELQDIEAGTDWLLSKRWADKKRVFATGGSYGGYMVAWMNGHVPAGRYQAYVCHAGCFDWTAMFAGDAYDWFGKELGALYWDEPAKIAAQSPHTFAQHMTTPTLVIHGAMDYRVPDAQGLAYYNTLKARGVDARLLWFPDENHWVLKPQNSRLWYAEFLGWLSKHSPRR